MRLRRYKVQCNKINARNLQNCHDTHTHLAFFRFSPMKSEKHEDKINIRRSTFQQLEVHVKKNWVKNINISVFSLVVFRFNVIW